MFLVPTFPHTPAWEQKIGAATEWRSDLSSFVIEVVGLGIE